MARNTRLDSPELRHVAFQIRIYLTEQNHLCEVHKRPEFDHEDEPTVYIREGEHLVMVGFAAFHRAVAESEQKQCEMQALAEENRISCSIVEQYRLSQSILYDSHFYSLGTMKIHGV